MRLIYAALALVVALSACARNEEKTEAPPEEEVNAISLSIEIGRYGVMLSQVHSLTGELPATSAETDASDPTDMARRLRETVWEYNLERSSLCSRGLYTELSCTPAFQPVWIGEPTTVAPTLEEVRVRSAAVGEEVNRFWSVVCAEARTREADEEARQYVCAME